MRPCMHKRRLSALVSLLMHIMLHSSILFGFEISILGVRTNRSCDVCMHHKLLTVTPAKILTELELQHKNMVRATQPDLAQLAKLKALALTGQGMLALSH